MRRLLVASCLALLARTSPAAAQSGTLLEGAIEFTRAIGARSIGAGQAVVAASPGAEAVWVNPALIAWSGREAAFDFRNQASPAEADADIALSLVYPWRPVGSVAVFVRYLNNGVQEGTSGTNDPVSQFGTSTVILGASFATTFFDRLALGVTAKQLQYRFSCTGQCDAESTDEPAVRALDVGAQLRLRRDSSITIGASVTNVGYKFQLKDSPQADPLPARATVGVAYVPRVSVPDIGLRFAADVVTRISDGTGPGFRLGGEATYLRRYSLRAGYMHKGPGEISTPTIGLGLARGKLHIDLAQMMTNLGAQNGRPTFLSLQYAF